MKENKQTQFIRFIQEDDTEFYEEYLAELSESELQNFLDHHPEFLRESQQ